MRPPYVFAANLSRIDVVASRENERDGNRRRMRSSIIASLSESKFFDPRYHKFEYEKTIIIINNKQQSKRNAHLNILKGGINGIIITRIQSRFLTWKV